MITHVLNIIKTVMGHILKILVQPCLQTLTKCSHNRTQES